MDDIHSYVTIPAITTVNYFHVVIFNVHVRVQYIRNKMSKVESTILCMLTMIKPLSQGEIVGKWLFCSHGMCTQFEINEISKFMLPVLIYQ